MDEEKKALNYQLLQFLWGSDDVLSKTPTLNRVDGMMQRYL